MGVLFYRSGCWGGGVPLYVYSSCNVDSTGVGFEGCECLLGRRTLLVRRFCFMVVVPYVSPMFLSGLVFFTFPWSSVSDFCEGHVCCYTPVG